MADRVTESRKLGLWGRLKRLALSDVGALVRGFRAADVEAMERTLLEADLGIAATADLVDLVEQEVRKGAIRSADELRAAISGRLAALLAGPADPTRLARPESGPTVLVVMGVNGSGKTTTVAKLAHWYSRAGETVLVVAADTYRAGAIEQLRQWADRLQVPVVAGAPGGDPAAVAYDGIEAAIARQASLVIVDTAGRLHTQEGLMEELRKVGRVVGRKVPGAPHECFLVLDGTVGQNAVQQARLFARAIPPTGLVITKLDGTARGGAVVALRRELEVPIRFLGRGEGLGDLEPFDPHRFAAELVADDD